MYDQRVRTLAAAVLISLCFLGFGCGGSRLGGGSPTGELLVVNFEEHQPLRYRMISERRTLIDLTSGSSSQRQQAQTMSERLELVMVYTPVEVDRFGLTTLRATCESATVTRTSFSGRQAARDAVESLPEMPFTLTLTPTGQIHDLSDFRRVIRQLGDKAFVDAHATAGRVKAADMISDFMAMQWCVWDSIASVENPSRGLEVGARWQVRQLVPWPAPVSVPPVRLTTFSLDRIDTEDGQQKAYIRSTYALSDQRLSDVPQAYEGTFQMQSLFGFLRRYRFESIDGEGTQIFNIDTGVLERDDQRYTLHVGADFAMPLGDSKPTLKVDQTLSIELLQ